MIREWCVCCGDRLGPNSKSDTYCNYCRGFSGETRAECAALMEVERQVREEIAIRHMVGFGRGFTASDAFLAGAPGIVVRQVTTKDEG